MPARKLVCIILWMSCAAPVSAARVYRCSQADGGISFQQQACSAEGQLIETGEAQPAWSALRPEEKRLYESYRSRDRERLARRREARLAVSREARADERGCLLKRQRLETVNARLRGGYRAGQGRDLRRRRDQYEEYLRRFCR